MAATTLTSRQGDTISAIAHRYYGTSRGKVEQILEANPHLSRHRAILPSGIEIIMPEAAAPGPIGPIAATVNLWD